MARGGRRKGPRVARPRPEEPTRMCIGSREQHPRGDMVRLVCGPDGIVRVDRHLKAPGRGAHLSYDAESIRVAVKRRALARAFKGQIKELPDEETLRNMIIEAIDARLDDTLRLARRARKTLVGTERVLEALKKGKVSLVLMAEDTAEGTADRISRTAAAVETEAIVFRDRAWLGEIQGGTPVVALALLDRGVAERVRLELTRRHRVLVAG